jgi:hypothetical protein
MAPSPQSRPDDTSMVSAPPIPRDGLWTDFQVSDDDIDFITNLLLEREHPLTPREMLEPLVSRKLEQARQVHQEPASEHVRYAPGGSYQVGDELLFANLGGAVGTVRNIRLGENPELGPFKVIEVDLDGDSTRRSFAAELADHALNRPASPEPEAEQPETVAQILEAHETLLERRLNERLSKDGDIVQIAGRWFPRTLLAEIHPGHLNLAEAVLDVGGGGPLPTSALLEHIELPPGLDPLLATFSVDYALQEDERFDEVGPAGQTLWYLRRLEPPEVLYTPQRLEYKPREVDRSRLTRDLLDLERRLDDELSPLAKPSESGATISLALLFPHWRVGALPLSSRLQLLFPTAYEAPRIRFILVDGHSGEKFPGWVVRAERYVYGLEDWYRRYDLPAGGLIEVRRGDEAGEVIVEVQELKRRTDWIRTVTVENGRVGFTMLKQPVSVAYDDLMVVGLTDAGELDQTWLKGDQRKMTDAQLIAYVFRELAKLNPQSAVHAQSLYSGVNVLRRLPPDLIFAELVASPNYEHVGDLYWRVDSHRQDEG